MKTDRRAGLRNKSIPSHCPPLPFLQRKPWNGFSVFLKVVHVYTSNHHCILVRLRLPIAEGFLLNARRPARGSVCQ